MIITNSPTPKTINRKLEDSNFEYYLTGSRFFGDNNQDSDTDYMTKDNPGVRKELEALGFKLDDNHDYKDKTTVIVCWHPGDEGSRNGYHVQLVVNVETKLRAQKIIKESLLPVYMATKRNGSTSDLWNFVLSLCE